MQGADQRTVWCAIPDLHVHCFREILTGAVAWARSRTGWELRIIRQPQRELLPLLEEVGTLPDGVLIYDLEQRFRRRLTDLHVSFVDLLSRPGDPPEAVVFDPGWAQQAVDHLLAEGYQRLLYAAPARESEKDVAEIISDTTASASRRGFSLEVLTLTRAEWDRAERSPFAAMLRGRLPLGVICYDDLIAGGLSWSCRRLGIAVPDQIGLLGRNDDPLESAYAALPLSSVRFPFREIGRHGMAELARRLEQRPAPERQLHLPPLGVAARDSTARRRLGDALVRRALARAEADPRATVEGLARLLAVGRSTLERRARAVLGRPLAEELRQRRLRQLRERLAGGEHPQTVAKALGMSARGLRAFCRRHLGQSPVAWAEIGKRRR